MLRHGLSKKIDSVLNTSYQDLTLMIMSHILMVSQGSVLGLASMSGTWDPL